MRSSRESETRKLRKLRKLRTLWKHWLHRIHHNVPPGLRTVLGMLLIVGGIFGLLPILGFWMIPLGITVVAMDLKPLAGAWSRWRDRRN